MQARACVALAFVVAFAGCLGSAAGPHVPAGELRSHGWSQDGDASTSTVARVAEVRTLRYGPGGSSEVAGMILVSVTDVPLVPESRFVPREIAAFEAREGIDLVPAGTETVTLPNAGGAEVVADLYDVRGAGLPAKGILVEFRCADPDVFVVAVGYGALPASGTLLKPAGADLWSEAKALVRSVTCR